MSQPKIIALSTVESVQIESTGKFVKLSILIAGRPMVSKAIPPAAAQRIADALGFACNDLQFQGGQDL